LTANQFPIDPTAHLIHEALEQLGWHMDAQALAARIMRLQFGLPAEDEFSMILSWLGKCRLVHKLDQQQTPLEAKGYYQIPDLLSLFDYNGRSVPVLIEVKATQSDSLSWKPSYFETLRRYGQQLGLPVLVAWKLKPMGIWTLFELKHFNQPKQNYRVTFETAIQESLLGLLAGDFAFIFKGGVGLHLKARKLEAKASESKEGGEIWHLQIEDAYFTDGEGNRTKRLGPGLWSLFLSAPLEEQTQVTETHILQSFVIHPESRMQFAHRALAVLLELQMPKDKPLRWREVLMGHRIPIESSALRKAAEDGLSQGILRYVATQSPLTKPDFLGKQNEAVPHPLEGSS
jgi:Holliday junction resolvase